MFRLVNPSFWRVGKKTICCSSSFQNASFSTSFPLREKRTPLYDAHVRMKGKMVNFAGWSLPVLYEKPHIGSHEHTRNAASIFDVSHMSQIIVTDKDYIPFLEKVTVADLQGMETGKTTYSLIPNENGGIVDDCMMTKYEDHVHLVVNAACAEKDWNHLVENAAGFDVELLRYNRSLIALQGPLAPQVLQELITDGTDLTEMYFLHGRNIAILGEKCLVTRCGYTGEDGFEISVPNSKAMDIWTTLAANENVWPAGLAVRDSLRLESGLCLYGNDIDETTTPGEASLLWTIPKKRRQTGGFVGDKVILEQISKKDYKRKRVGIALTVRGVAREGSTVLNPESGEVVGSFTSGTYSPILHTSIGMAYVTPEFAKIGTEVKVQVKAKIFDAKITKMPFLPTNYYTPPPSS